MIKLVFCLRRKAGLSREAFQKYWREEHAALVRDRAAAIGAVRYVQVHTAHDDVNEVLRASRGGPEPFDGVAELWFENRAALEAAFGTDAGREAGGTLLEDERSFIDLEQSPLWIGEEHPILGGAG